MESSEEGKRISTTGLDPAVEPVADKLHRAARAGMQSIPVVGGLANEIFCSLVVNPAEARRQAWMETVSEVVNEVCEGVDQLQELVEDPAFVSTLMTASALAMRTGEPEKIGALKAAIYNSALGQSEGEATQQMHLAALATLTSIHLHLLEFFESRNPETLQAFGQHNLADIQGWFYSDFSRQFPLQVARGTLERAARDLVSLGLVAVPDKFPQTMTGPNFVTMMLTEFGRSFVSFIRKTEQRDAV